VIINAYTCVFIAVHRLILEYSEKLITSTVTIDCIINYRCKFSMRSTQGFMQDKTVASHMFLVVNVNSYTLVHYEQVETCFMT